MNIELLIADLQRDEGVRRYPYDDATGKPIKAGDTVVGKITIGVGRNLSDRGLTEEEIGRLLAEDIGVVCEELDVNVPWWRDLPEPAQRALANMCFNVGWPRLSKFQRMLAALQARDFPTAAWEALSSRWAEQVGARALRIAHLFEEAGR